MNNKIVSKLLRTPIELIIFFLFSISVSIFSFIAVHFCSVSFRESIIPYTGWGIDGTYSGCWFFSLLIIFNKIRTKQSNIIMYGGLVGLLVISVVLGFFDLHNINGENFGNPYLTVSSLRPIWTMIIPGFWILILITPRVRKFCLLVSQSRGGI